MVHVGTLWLTTENTANRCTLSPTLAFLLFGAVSGAVSLFLVETMSTIHGNESFQARVEYSTVAHLYMGNKIHIVMQILLYCALQSVNLSSIIISEQTMDSLLIQIFHKTCALSFTKGWTCGTTDNSRNRTWLTRIWIQFLRSAPAVRPSIHTFYFP
jgi:H+/Cl- antiporter ClcA